jgi:hypothetical protein
VRLWSVHPRYLDTVGLTACWREGLLAQKVLTGTTRGYRQHPQLERFRPGSALAAGRVTGWPGDRVVAYLHALADEADARGNRYDRSRVAGPRPAVEPDEVTEGQLAYEWALLCGKLAGRSPDVLARWGAVGLPDPNPCFKVVPGPVAAWEVVLPEGR